MEISVRQFQQLDEKMLDVDFVVGLGEAEGCGEFKGIAAGTVEFGD